MRVERVQDNKYHFLCSHSSLHSIWCYRCQWYTSLHNWSKPNDSISKNNIFLLVMQLRLITSSSQSVPSQFPIAVLIRIYIVQAIVNGCCDFIAQCTLVCINHCAYHPPFYSPKTSKIYRCWIVWGKNIRVVIVPSLLAITYLGQSTYLHLISWFQFIVSSYLASATWYPL